MGFSPILRCTVGYRAPGYCNNKIPERYRSIISFQYHLSRVYPEQRGRYNRPGFQSCLNFDACSCLEKK